MLKVTCDDDISVVDMLNRILLSCMKIEIIEVAKIGFLLHACFENHYFI